MEKEDIILMLKYELEEEIKNEHYENASILNKEIERLKNI